MANTYEKLVAAGAPAIVEPLFYRIYEDYRSKALVVEIRERAAYRGSHLKASRRVAPGLASVMAERVAEAAQECLDEITYKETVSTLVGVGSSTGNTDV